MDEHIACPKCDCTNATRRSTVSDRNALEMALQCQNPDCLAHYAVIVTHLPRSRTTKISVVAVGKGRG